MKSKIFPQLLLIGLALVLGACAESRNAEPEIVLRTYQVPVSHQERIRSALRNALISKDAGTNESGEYLGKVSLVDNGLLLVSAPPGIQEGVAQFLKDFQPAAVPELPAQQQMAIDFWVVMAHDRNASASADQGLEEIADVLAAIKGTQSLQDFMLVERLSISNAQSPQSIRGARVEINLHDGRDPDALKVIIQAQPEGYRGAKMDAYFKLEPGKTIVLGQSGLAPAQGGDSATGNASIFYVVKSRILE